MRQAGSGEEKDCESGKRPDKGRKTVTSKDGGLPTGGREFLALFAGF
jgi:hypothetical protein